MICSQLAVFHCCIVQGLLSACCFSLLHWPGSALSSLFFIVALSRVCSQLAVFHCCIVQGLLLACCFSLLHCPGSALSSLFSLLHCPGSALSSLFSLLHCPGSALSSLFFIVALSRVCSQLAVVIVGCPGSALSMLFFIVALSRVCSQLAVFAVLALLFSEARVSLKLRNSGVSFWLEPCNCPHLLHYWTSAQEPSGTWFYFETMMRSYFVLPAGRPLASAPGSHRCGNIYIFYHIGTSLSWNYNTLVY